MFSFNIWAFTAAHKALEKKLQQKTSHSSLRKQRSAPSLKHLNNLNKLPDGLLPPSTSDSLANGAVLSSLSPASPGVNSAETPSPVSTSRPTSRQSTIDFTQPIITYGAAVAANTKPISFGEVQSEADSDEDYMSVTSESTVEEEERGDAVPAKGIVTVHGTEPLYGNVNLVSERVSVHGNIRPFEPVEAVPALQPSLREHIGQVHGDGAIRKWLARRHEWDKKYSKDLAKWRDIKQKDRIKAEAEGFLTRDLQGERPPLCSVAGIWEAKLARDVARSVDEVTSRSMGLGWWTKWGSKVSYNIITIFILIWLTRYIFTGGRRARGQTKDAGECCPRRGTEQASLTKPSKDSRCYPSGTYGDIRSTYRRNRRRKTVV